MSKRPIVIRHRPAKAVAIEAEPIFADRWLTFIHAVLAFLLPFLLLALTGCIPRDDGAPVDYGPQVEVATLNEALTTPIQDMDPLNIKLGEFRAIENSQEIIGMPGKQLISAQGVTITAASNTSTQLLLTAVITELTYKNDGTFEKVSREGPVCVSKVPGACGEDVVPTPGSMAAKAFSSPVVYIENTVKALASNITFHRLKMSTETVPVPPSVATRPNCGGIPSCQMTVYKVGFDQVEWVDGKGHRVHIDVSLSPSVPYLSNQLEACFTGLVEVGKTSDVLVKQCSSVYDFRFESP
ncbi:MAG: hypothetical protein AAB250_15465 [Bdellovibrionota bacterium]